MNIERNKMICTWYRNGMRIRDIAKELNMNQRVVCALLKKWYPKFYETPYVGKLSQEYRDNFYAELYEKYKRYYIPYAQTRTELMQLIDCSPAQFNKLCEIYNLDYQRLKVYKTQKTLCNVPIEFYNNIKKVAKELGFKSVRQFAVCAINEYLLQYEEEELPNDSED